MRPFDQFVSEPAAEYGGINLIFEAGMYSLVNDLEQLVKALREAGVKFEVVGGAAVNAHVVTRNRSRSFVTRDIDILLSRDDLPDAAKAGESLGYEAKKMMGGFALVRPGQDLGQVYWRPFSQRRPAVRPYRPRLPATLLDFSEKSVVLRLQQT